VSIIPFWLKGPIRVFPDMALRETARPLTDEDFKYARELATTMSSIVHRADALGLAATQLGVRLRMFAFRSDDGRIRIAVNPTIETSGALTEASEKCLSIRNVRASIIRPEHARMTYLDLDGTEHTISRSGLWARVLQHENDHLNGVLIIDHATDGQLLPVAESVN
jgi:peptide deformylase